MNRFTIVWSGNQDLWKMDQSVVRLTWGLTDTTSKGISSFVILSMSNLYYYRFQIFLAFK